MHQHISKLEEIVGKTVTGVHSGDAMTIAFSDHTYLHVNIETGYYGDTSINWRELDKSDLCGTIGKDLGLSNEAEREAWKLAQKKVLDDQKQDQMRRERAELERLKRKYGG